MNMLSKIQAREEKRKIIKKEINAGRIFSVDWVKNNGELAKDVYKENLYSYRNF